jgi:tetratricopeptide (TPR) repeat protein
MKAIRVIAVLGVGSTLVAGAMHVSDSSAQQPAWSWPEKAKNLKVLPKDTDSQRLRAAMTGFTRALGVRCNHCHVGKEGQPLSTFDFASDENHHKEIARGMMRMTDSINADVARIVAAAEPHDEAHGAHHEERVTVACATCHRGVARPRMLSDVLATTYQASGADSTLARYRTLRARYYGSSAYDFTEGSLGEVARRALEKKDYPGAIAMLRFNVEQFPESGFAHGSLAEAYLSSGDTTSAVAELERSVQLDPRNERNAKMLERLKSR